jgi:hypothetical protein
VTFRTTVEVATISRIDPTVNVAVIDSDETAPDGGTDGVRVVVVPPPQGGNPTPKPSMPITAAGVGPDGTPITVPRSRSFYDAGDLDGVGVALFAGADPRGVGSGRSDCGADGGVGAGGVRPSPPAACDGGLPGLPPPPPAPPLFTLFDPRGSASSTVAASASSMTSSMAARAGAGRRSTRDSSTARRAPSIPAPWSK